MEDPLSAGGRARTMPRSLVLPPTLRRAEPSEEEAGCHCIQEGAELLLLSARPHSRPRPAPPDARQLTRARSARSCLSSCTRFNARRLRSLGRARIGGPASASVLTPPCREACRRDSRSFAQDDPRFCTRRELVTAMPPDGVAPLSSFGAPIAIALLAALLALKIGQVLAGGVEGGCRRRAPRSQPALLAPRASSSVAKVLGLLALAEYRHFCEMMHRYSEESELAGAMGVMGM